jgi:acetate kinase
MTRVLVLNCGSSSVKYRLFEGDATVAKGLLQRIGEVDGDAPDHEAALRHILSMVDTDGLAVVGHRMVHGGSAFTAPTLITGDMLDVVRRMIPLAPLHNPANITGVEVATRLLPGVPQVGIFDTAFHRSIPPPAATYAIDAEVTQESGIERYGFHGTSHAYVSRRTAALLGRPLETVNTITLHLGNGASACAVEGGRSVATSMGLSPLEGLVMGTRSGDIDPAVVFFLCRAGWSVQDVDTMLNKRSGLLGMCGDNDMRTVEARRAKGDPAATLAFDVYCHRIKEYVGAHAAVLGRLDAITFTAGVGENSSEVRAKALAGLDFYGIAVDPARNAAEARGERLVSPDGSRVAICVIPTDEELEIATQARAVLSGQR